VIYVTIVVKKKMKNVKLFSAYPAYRFTCRRHGRQVCKNFAPFAVKKSDEVTKSQSDKVKLISSSVRQLASYQ